MVNYLIIAVVALAVGLAAYYIHKSKKKGVKCIGCPEGCSCSSGSCMGCKGCGSENP